MSTCDATLSRCECSKLAGHVQAGDDVHLCAGPGHETCGGSWRGEHPNVVVLRWPAALGNPATARLAERLNAAMPPEGVPLNAPGPLPPVPRGGIRYGRDASWLS